MSPGPPVWTPKVAAGLALAVAGISALVLLGWAVGSVTLVRIAPNYAAMVPPTAICFLLSGIGLVVNCRGGAALAPVSAAVVVALTAAVDLAFAEARVSLDLVSFPFGGALPGDAMAIGTAMSFLIAAYSLAAMSVQRLYQRLLFHGLNTFGLALALSVLVSYLFDAEALYRVNVFTSMALHTALCFALLFAAFLIARAQDGWMGIVFGSGRGSAAARRLLPAALLVPVLLSLMASAATDAGVLTTDVRLSILAVLMAFLAVYAVLSSAANQNASELAQGREAVRLRGIIDAVDAALLAVDRDRQVVFANRQAIRMTRQSASPAQWLAETPFLNAASLQPLEPQERPLARMEMGDTLKDARIAYHDADGAKRVLRLLAGDEIELDGRPVRMLAATDITEEERVAQRLTRAERLDALGQMAGGIAHDIANTLGVIRLTADVGAMDKDADRMRTKFAAIQAACQRARHLTDRVLTFARHQPGLTDIIDLSAAVSDLGEWADRMIPSNITLGLSVDEGPLFARCEFGQLESALLNLILNARDAISTTERGGTIVLGARSRGEEVEVFVEDDGPGMSEDVRSRATDPFFTTHPSTGGTGLGLAQVEAFATGNGGVLELHSREGGGCTAVICLPRAAPESTDIPVPRREIDLSGLHLLVVEDDPTLGSALELALTELGAQITRAESGNEAIRKAEASSFDVLVTDIMLSGSRNGFAVANALNARSPGLPVVYVSGYADSEAQSLHQVPGLFLRKPVGAEDIARGVMTVLKR